MTTLKEHEQKISALRTRLICLEPDRFAPLLLAEAVHDILAHLNATAAPNNNDALLANDLKACAPQNASESARIKELEETVRQLRKNNAGLKRQNQELRDDSRSPGV